MCVCVTPLLRLLSFIMLINSQVAANEPNKNKIAFLRRTFWILNHSDQEADVEMIKYNKQISKSSFLNSFLLKVYVNIKRLKIYLIYKIEELFALTSPSYCFPFPYLQPWVRLTFHYLNQSSGFFCICFSLKMQK